MNKDKQSTFLGGSSLLLVGIIYAVFGIFVRLMDQYFDSNSQIVARNIGLVVIVLVISILFKKNISFKVASRKGLVLFGICYVLEVVLFTYSLIVTNLGIALVTYYFGCFILSFIVAKIYFKEKIQKVNILALILCLIGIGVISLPMISSGVNWGIVIAIVAGCFNALANSFRKSFDKNLSTSSILLVQGLFGVFLTSFILFILNSQIRIVITLDSIILALIFSFLLFLTSYLIIYGFQRFDLNLGTIFTSSEMIFAGLFGFLFYLEIPSSYDIIGSILILSAIILPTTYHAIKNKNISYKLL